MSMNEAEKTLMGEYNKLKNQESEEFEISDPLEDKKPLHWQILIFGKDGTPYESGMFFFNVEFPDTYPGHPPKKIKCSTKIYHPNIDSKGQICFQGLKDTWSSSMNAKSVIQFIIDLINNPDCGDAINSEVAKCMQEDMEKFKSTAAKWVEEYAS